MKYLAQLFSCSLLLILSGCAEPKFTGTPSPYLGTYVGTETLEGGTTVSRGDYPLKIYIYASGKVRIVDVDQITAYGQLEGNSFRVVRSSPTQVFEGKIENKIISGVTTKNIFTGDGTFSLTLKEN